MERPLVAVADLVFPNLDAAERVLSAIGAELRLACSPTPDALVRVARTADAVRVTYARRTGHDDSGGDDSGDDRLPNGS